MIFDSLVHPTISGSINKYGVSTSFSDIENERRKSGIDLMMAVGMPTTCYNHQDFYEECLKFKKLIPIAALTRKYPLEEEMNLIKSIGYKAVKIHPRSLQDDFDSKQLEEALLQAAKLDLRVLLCTYCFCDLRRKNLITLDDILKIISVTPPTLKLMLVHGGVFDLLKFLEFSKYTENLLVDLSFTMMKYPGSSLEKDITFAMKYYDRKICIGSDFPDFQLKDFVKKANEFTSELSEDKRNNIQHSNLKRFMGME